MSEHSKKTVVPPVNVSRPEWSIPIDPVLQKELERQVLVTSWNQLTELADTLYNWGRRSSLWPLGFGLACCAIEMICTASSRFDISRFGAEVFRASPRQADVMIVSGTVTKTMIPVIVRLYDQMTEPKYVISMGACASGGGPFKEGYNVVSGVDKFLPVDVYVAGCPPTPNALLQGLITLQKRIDGETLSDLPWYKESVEREIPIPVLGPDLIDLRTVELAAERTAMGLIEKREAGLTKPVLHPAPQLDLPPVSEQPKPETPAMSKAEQIRARMQAGTAAELSAAPVTATPAAAAPTTVAQATEGPARPKVTRKVKVAEPRPSLRWLGNEGLAGLNARLNDRFGAGTSEIVKAGLLVPAEAWLKVARYLKDENVVRYNYLSSLQSVHYSDCIEVNYHLDSTLEPGSLIQIRVRCSEDEGLGVVPSVIEVWPGADLQEREVYDMMGVQFTGHPNLTRILMWEGFAGYPLRKDYLEPYYEGPTKVLESRIADGQHVRSEELNPYGTNLKIPKDFKGWDSLDSASDPKNQVLPLAAEGVSVSAIDSESFVLSMGPQHPSTHGVFRMNLRVDGESIIGLKPVMGYMHRNHEKIGERNTFLMNFPFTDRLDYLTSMANNFSYALAVEQLMGDDLKVPERAEYLRVIMAELTRIVSHLWSIGFQLNDLGAFFTPALYAIEERELILDLFEWVSGSRMMCNYFRFGGVGFDLPPGWLERCRRIVENRLEAKIDELDRLLSTNEILIERSRGVGVLSAEEAIAFSTSGPVLRGSGVAHDLRRAIPYSIYDRFQFNVITHAGGDIYARFRVRLLEMRESVQILKQALRDLPGGPILPGKKSYQVKVPAGEALSRTESPKGELGFYLVSDGVIGAAYRYHIRSPSFINLTALERMCLGHTIADVVGILGSLDIVLGEVDR